ncbi:MAG: hypothetical protein AAFO07_08110 [Bacteroidota bacterium]
MDNSIKRIWKEGFTEADLSSVPQINNFEELKSIYFIDKFKNIYKKNIAGLVLTAVLVFIAFTAGGTPFIGLFVCILFLTIAALALIELNKLDQLNLGTSNYNFLKSFESWLFKMQSRFLFAYKIIVPLLFIGFSLALLRTELMIPFIGETLYERLIYTGFGNTVVIGTSLLIITISILLSYFSSYLFKREFHAIYGETVRNISGLVKELDDLR